MNHYNELTRDDDNNYVLFSPSYGMSGVRTAVNIMVFSIVVSVILLPINIDIFFIWLFVCSYFYKGEVESKMGSGYPCLEVGNVLGLVILYLIALPIAFVIYFVFLGGYVYVSELFIWEQGEGLVARLLGLLLFWFFYMLFLRNKKWDIRNLEWKKEFKTQELKMEVSRSTGREKNGNYEDFVKGLKSKFKPSKDIKDLKDIKDPVISKKRLGNFIEWLEKVSKDKDRNFDLIDSLIKNKKLEVLTPNMEVLFLLVTRLDAIVDIDFLDDFGMSVYMITEKSATHKFEFDDNKKWVNIINNKKVTCEVWEEIYDLDPSEFEASGLEAEELYLEEGNFHIPYNDKYKELYDNEDVYPTYDNNDYCLYLAQEAYFWTKDILINGDGFRFKEDEKEYLITLLMASYKPRLLKRIKDYSSLI